MSKKLILFLMVLLFGSANFSRAEVVTIGEGTGTTYYFPIDNYFNYSCTEQIYLAEEIGTAGTINTVSFYYNYGTAYSANNVTMYMKHVTRSNFANSTDCEALEAGDVVWAGNIAPTEAGWYTFTLDTPFDYDGESNLLIAFFDGTSGYPGTSYTWRQTTAPESASMALRYYSDSTCPDPYNLASYSGSKQTYTYRGNVQLDITAVVPPTPPTPTGDLAITPNPFEMAYRPVNGWMEPYTVKITNGGQTTTTIEGTLSNTSGDAPFALSVPVSATLESGDVFSFDIEINNSADGEYNEEFTLFYALNSKDIVTIPVTANIYTAEAGDIVETAKNVTWSGDAYTDTPDLATIHPNYNLYGMTEMKPDAVYKFTLGKDSRFHATAGDDFIAVYEYAAGLQLTEAVEPVLLGTSGIIDDEVLLKGTYYLVVASNNISDVNIERVELPAPSALVALAPADMATGLTGNINLTWEGGDNATEYRVLFGTSPTNIPVVKDWTAVDVNYGTFSVTSLVQNNTQYFWQIQAKNSEGQVQTTRRGFTTALTTPNTVTATPDQIFVDGSTLIKWKHSAGGGGVIPETQIGSGTTSNSYLPSYSFYNYSLTQQIYTADEIGSTGVINSISFYNSGSEKTRNYTMYLVNTTKETFASATDWIVVTAGDQVFQGNVTMAAAAWTTITLAEPFNYTGDNLAIVMDDNTGSYSSGMSCYVFNAAGNQAIRIFNDNTNYNPLAPSSYSGTTLSVKNQIIINKESKGGELTRSFLGFNIYDGDVKLNESLITEKQYLLEDLAYSMPAAHPISVTAVYDEGESELATPAANVYVSGYATIQGRVTELISHSPIAGASVRFFGKDEFNNDVNYEAITNNSGDYTVEVAVGTYNRGMAMFTGMQTAEMEESVTVEFDGVATVDFVLHEVYNPVMSVVAEEVDPSMARIFWSMTHNLRGVSYYTLYRKAILKEAALVPADSVMLVDNYTDTLNVDFNWNNMLPGLYQYGVSAVYPSPAKRGNRDQVVIGDGTTTTYVTPYNSLWGYSLVEQIYTAEEIGTPGMINSIAFNLRDTDAAQTNQIQVFMQNIDKETFASADDIVPMTEADKVFEGTFTFNPGWSTIELDNPFFYDGTNNLLIAIHEYTSGYSTRYFYYTAKEASVISYHSDSADPNPLSPAGYSGNKYTSPNRANITIDITPGGGGGGTGDDPVTPITWSNVLPKDMETAVTVNVTVPVGSVEGTYVEFINQFEEGTDFIATLDETGTVTFDNFRKGNYLFTVALDKYTTPYTETPVSIWDETTYDIVLSEIFDPVDAIAVSGTGFARWTEVVPVDRIAEKYFLKLNGAFLTETTDNYYQFEDLEEGETYTAAVAVVYSLGMSEYVETSFTYTGCAAVPQQVEGLAVDTASCADMNVVLVWNGGTPTPTPPTPPTPPTGNTFDFDDNTMQGWTSIDADGDGNGWVSSANPGIYHNSGVNLAGTGHNASNSYVISGSYANQTGAALHPNNFLVSPNKAEYTAIDFFACAQDANYAAEHFGVYVSTAGNTSASDFTMVQEWTLTAKSGSDVISTGRGGQTRTQGNWYEKTVDLSAYAGQEIYVAICHFNCTDQFILNVDDITLGEPEKASMDVTPYASVVTAAPAREMWDLITTFTAPEGGHYGVVADNEYIYTSNWGYSSAAHNFYKYDMEGNMIEGFEISGCGTLRGMTFDGEYVYGVANAATIYCVDLNNHALISTTTSAYGAMRGITYDPQRDGFWVIGNWSGNLTLIDRTGAIQFTGPAPTSASDLAYFKDPDGVEHVFCFNNADNGVYDYNITTNTMGGQVFNFSSTPGYNSGSSGGCHVAQYGEKIAFYGDLQQSPNLIAIYELCEGGSTPVSGTWVPNKYNILVDGELVAATGSCYFTYECPDYDNHVYTVVWVDANYNVSCEASVEYEIHHLGVAENELVNAIYPNPTSGDLHINAEAMTRVSIVNTMGQVVYEQNVNADAIVVDMAKFEAGVYMVNIYTENGSSVKRVTVVK